MVKCTQTIRLPFPLKKSAKFSYFQFFFMKSTMSINLEHTCFLGHTCSLSIYEHTTHELFGCIWPFCRAKFKRFGKHCETLKLRTKHLTIFSLNHSHYGCQDFWVRFFKKLQNNDNVKNISWVTCDEYNQSRSSIFTIFNIFILFIAKKETLLV